MAIARTSLMAAILLFTVGAAAAFAADENNVRHAMYLQYCGACHGPSGKGDGVAGTFMRPKPSGLTQIAKRDNGQFPYQHVVQVIDGTNPVRPHGESDMPVWGEVLRDEAGSSLGRRAEVQAKIMFITEYLRSIQEK
jgi:mono/diheme cytochrome c family protein